jgi:hypothetical protein
MLQLNERRNRTSLSRVPAVFALLHSAQTASFAGSKPVELKWSELAPMIQSRRVELTLVDGVKLKGKTVVVREDSIVLENASVPRSSVSLIKLEKARGSWGRRLGTVIGVVSGLVVGGYVTAVATNSAGAGIPLFLGMASGVTLGGYYIGREIDRRTTLIKVVP